MEENIAKKIQQRLTEISPDVRKAIESVDFDSHIQEVGKKHQLHVDQVGALEDEVLMVMLGFTPLESFGDHVAAQLKVSPQAAQSIVQDVNQNVFLPVRESLKSFTAKKKGEAAPSPAPKPSTPPPPRPSGA